MVDIRQAPTRSLPRAIRIATSIAAALGVAWLCGLAMKLDARLTSPPGFGRGLLHGAMMPAAWPALMAGSDQEIYAARNSGRFYKVGYSMGVNLSGAVFFGIIFLGASALRGPNQRNHPE